MANIKSAEKRARQAVQRRAHNMAARSRLRTSIKKVLTAIGSGNRDEATAAFKAAQPVIDTMVTKGIIHRNKAARHKRELNAKIKALSNGAMLTVVVAGFFLHLSRLAGEVGRRPGEGHEGFRQSPSRRGSNPPSPGVA